MRLANLMEIIKTLIVSELQVGQQMQGKNTGGGNSAGLPKEVGSEAVPLSNETERQKKDQALLHSKHDKVSVEKVLQVQPLNLEKDASNTEQKPKRSFFRPNELHRMKASIQSENNTKKELIVQDKIEGNQMPQQATHLQINNFYKQNEDQQSHLKQFGCLQTKLEPVNFIVLIQAMQQNQADQGTLNQQKEEEMNQKLKKINFKKQNSKQILEDEQNLTPVSFRIVLKECEDMKIPLSKNKQANDKKKTKKTPTQAIRKSYLTHQVNNKYPMMLRNVSLEDLLTQVYQNRLISMALYQQWKKNSKNIADVYFLQLFSQERLQQFPFDKLKFTLLDHRRLSEVLTLIFPQKYKLGEIKNIHNEQRQFLAGIYDISAPQYYELCAGVDKISKVKWWLKLIIVHQDKLARITMGTKKKEQKEAQQQKETFQEFINIASNNAMNTPTIKKAQQEDSYFRLNQTFQSTDNLLQDKQTKFKTIAKKSKKGKQQQISQIRNLVSGFSKQRIDPQQPQQNPRKKIKFS